MTSMRSLAGLTLAAALTFPMCARAADVLTQSPRFGLADGSGRVVGTYNESEETSIIEVRGFGPVFLLLQPLNSMRLAQRFPVYFSRSGCEGNAYLRENTGRTAVRWLAPTMMLDGRGQYWIAESREHVPWAYDSVRSRLSADGTCQSITTDLVGWSNDLALTPVAPENAPAAPSYSVVTLQPGHVLDARLFDANGQSMGVLGYSLVLRTSSRELVSMQLDRAADGLRWHRSRIGFTEFGCRGDAFAAESGAVDGTGLVWWSATDAAYPQVNLRSLRDAATGACVDAPFSLTNQRRVTPMAQLPPQFVEPFSAKLVYR